METLWSKWDDSRCIGSGGPVVLELREIIWHKYDVVCNIPRGPGVGPPKQICWPWFPR